MEIWLAIGFIFFSLFLLRRSGSRVLKICIWVVYVGAIIYLAFTSREAMPIHHYSVYLLDGARRGLEFGGSVLAGLLHGDVKITNWAELRNIILNILLFVPFGYLLPTIFQRLRWWQVIILGFCGSMLIEVLQLITRLGYADVDDLINNTLGATIGWLLYRAMLKKK